MDTIIKYLKYDSIHDLYSAITDYSQDALQREYEEGARFFKIYSNGDKEEVLPEEVQYIDYSNSYSMNVVQPRYVNVRTEAIFKILNEILEPLLEILPDEESQEEEVVLKPMNVNLKGASVQSVQSVQAASTEESDISEPVKESRKDKIRRAFNDLKTLVEEGESFIENDQQ